MTRGPSLRESIAEPVVGRMPLLAVISGYMVALAAVVAVVGIEGAQSWQHWIGSGLAVILYGIAFAATLLPRPGRFGRRPAVVALGLVVAAQSATWVTIAVDDPSAVSAYQPLIATAYVVYVMIVFRNHLGLAWLGAAISLLLAFALGTQGTDGQWWSSLQTTCVIVLSVVTAAYFAMTPLLGEIDALAVRRKRLDDERGAAGAEVAARVRRIERIDDRVRPILEAIRESGRVSEADVRFARLTEARLRDGIRAPALDSDRVRESVWRARSRGVSVILLDDGGLRDLEVEEASSLLSALTDLLAAELDALPAGEIVARVAPPGRMPIASLTVALNDARRRTEFGRDGRVARVVQA